MTSAKRPAPLLAGSGEALRVPQTCQERMGRNICLELTELVFF